MNKTILSLALICSFSVSANDKSGFTPFLGYTLATGDVSGIADYNGGSAGGLAVGGSYTFSGGFILGAQVNPEVYSYSFSNYIGSYDESLNQVLIFAGYELDNGLRLTGGFTQATFEADETINGYGSGSLSLEEMGFNFGVGYSTEIGLVPEARISSVSMGNMDNTNITFNLGYKF